MQHAHAALRLKAAPDREDEQIIEGWASTPAPDRELDIVEPAGAVFASTVPLLWQHDARQPVGVARLGRPTAQGIPFSARLPKVTEPGRLKDRVTEAWHSIRHGLINAVSIGFRALPGGAERLETGGVRYTKYEILELSLVSIAAQPQVVITSAKAAQPSTPHAMSTVIVRLTSGLSLQVGDGPTARLSRIQAQDLRDQLDHVVSGRSSKSAELSIVADLASRQVAARRGGGGLPVVKLDGGGRKPGVVYVDPPGKRKSVVYLDRPTKLPVVHLDGKKR